LALNVVITGSTRGIGRGLAEALLVAGCRVMISGRTLEAVRSAGADLASQFPAERVAGHPADVSDYSQVAALWAEATARFGRVDAWVNNAGLSLRDLPLWQVPPEKIAPVVNTNITGLLYGCQVAAAGMLAQGGGAIFNMEGFGSTGRLRPGMVAYGSTKAAVAYITRALALDLRGTPVRVVSLSPGMVMSDMILGEYAGRPADWQRARRIFNIIGERVETVAPWLAAQVLSPPPNGARRSYLSSVKLFGRFLAAPFNHRDIFEGLEEPPA
jgi:NAD(P)-dependent dehydrogenase (short-subunit alcohol dehydrogenase family)